MKIIILAAGEGIRLRPYTLNKPKCMVEFNQTPIIDRILSVALFNQINEIVIVSGYNEEILKNHLSNKNIRFYTNAMYNTTNMLYSLFCAESEMNDDIIISYGDIIYKNEILKKPIDDQSPISVVVDKEWRELWSLRMEDPLKDAETMKIGKDGNIIELGKKPTSYNDIEGQYIGLIKIKKEALQKIIQFYKSLDREVFYDGKNFNNMYMTSFIQLLIDKVMPVKPVFIEGGWLEIDTVEDLHNYKSKAVNI